MPYTQTALALGGAAASEREQRSLTMHPTTRSEWPVTLRHTFTPSSRRLPGDLWGEYRFECETRDRMQLPEVSLAEFRDMRDWTDGCKENDDDDDWITAPDIDAPPYGCIRRWR